LCVRLLAYPRSGALERFFTLALLSNIRLGWKGLRGTNPLAYYEHLLIAIAKSSIPLGCGVNVITIFPSSLMMRLK
jgi:hypothetical protein